MEHSIDEVKNRYFNFIGKIERKLVKKWCKIEMAKTDEQLDFLKIVQASLDEVKYDYWLPNIEPSIDKYGRIYYKEGDEVATDISCSEWKKKAEQFAPSCGSELANLYELYLWYALRIVNGFWTLEYVCNTSSNEYSFSLDYKIEKSGIRSVGGAKDGVRNTYKIVMKKTRFALCGGRFYSVVDRGYIGDPDVLCKDGTGIVVLKK